MTETERIIYDGILPSQFFEAEYRDDFYVDEKRKRIWGISLDLLLKFSEVCKKNNLRWFLMFGTLLGAIRHAGFIPWDDDVDVAMPREDYEKLLSLGGQFEKPYFLQTPYTDEGYYYSYAKLRNSNTSSISKNFMYQVYNQGISLDIFPFDNWKKENDAENIFHTVEKLILNNSAAMKISNPQLVADVKAKFPVIDDPLSTYDKIHAYAQTYRDEEKAEYVCMPTITVYGYSRDVFFKSDFNEIIMKPFETFLFPVPCGYDRILQTVYGNYHEFPPLEKRGNWHAANIDPDVPYTEKKREMFNL